MNYSHKKSSNHGKNSMNKKKYLHLFLIFFVPFLGTIGISKTSLSMTIESLDSLNQHAPTVSVGGRSNQSPYSHTTSSSLSTNIAPASSLVSTTNHHTISSDPTGSTGPTGPTGLSDTIKGATSFTTLVPDVTTAAATNHAVQNAVQAATTARVSVCTTTITNLDGSPVSQTTCT